jgi:uncharacterized protein
VLSLPPSRQYQESSYVSSNSRLFVLPSLFPRLITVQCASFLTRTSNVLRFCPGIGKQHHKGATIQLLDLPGIIEHAASGKGRGRQVIAVARSADLVLIMLDATKSDVQRKLLETELEIAGIRINKTPPDIYYRAKKTGGIAINALVTLTKMTQKTVFMILKEYKIHNADVVIREDCTVDELIDVIEGNRQYIPALYVYNKIDAVSLEEVDRLAREPHSVVMSVNLELNLDVVVERIWDYLAMCRVYTKRPGTQPDFSDPIVLRNRSKVEDACRAVHRSLADSNQFKHALVWGQSTKHNPQRVGLAHPLSDEDVIQIFKK